MTTMIAELYDALKEAGASEEKARKAAAVVANYEREFADIKSDLKVLKWGQGITFTGVLAVLLKLLLA